MKKLLLVAAFVIGFSSSLRADEPREYAQVTLTGASDGKRPTTPRDQLVILVVDGDVITHDASPIPTADVVPLVNALLKEKKISLIGVYVREGTKYGDVVRAVDILRQTTAKNIGVSMHMIPPGREP